MSNHTLTQYPLGIGSEYGSRTVKKSRYAPQKSQSTISYDVYHRRQYCRLHRYTGTGDPYADVVLFGPVVSACDNGHGKCVTCRMLATKRMCCLPQLRFPSTNNLRPPQSIARSPRGWEDRAASPWTRFRAFHSIARGMANSIATEWRPTNGGCGICSAASPMPLRGEVVDIPDAENRLTPIPSIASYGTKSTWE